MRATTERSMLRVAHPLWCDCHSREAIVFVALVFRQDVRQPKVSLVQDVPGMPERPARSQTVERCDRWRVLSHLGVKAAQVPSGSEDDRMRYR